jgi:plastocyanin
MEQLEGLWNAILDLTARFVIPDWGAAVGLLPALLLLIIAIYLVRTAWRFAQAGPTRRGPRRRVPLAPASVHMPGPSAAPFLGAFGTFLLLVGLVFGGPWLWIGLVAIVGGLLYWGREGLTEFDHLAHAERLPAVVHGPPPPGVHVPGPSFRPFLGALGSAALFLGLVFPGWLLAAGLLLFVVALLGWLRDARLEYLKTTEADRTGHLENIPAPNWPRRLFVTFVIVFAVAVAIDAGILFASPSEAPAGGGGAGGGGGEPPSACAEPAIEHELVAVGIAYDVKELCVPADTAFTIHFANQDPPGIPHDVDIESSDGTVLQNTETIDGGQDVTYTYEPLAAGEYVFQCSIHPIPAMTGTLVVQ